MSDLVSTRSSPLSAQHASTDAHVISLWLRGRSEHTQRAYRADVDRFLTFVATPLASVTLGDVQAFADSLEGLAPSPHAPTID